MLESQVDGNDSEWCFGEFDLVDEMSELSERARSG